MLPLDYQKMLLRILNLESSLFPILKEELRLEELSHKEQKLIKILDFAQIEKNITVVSITNTPKHREEIARAFIAKSVYNIQTTRDLIDRLKNDRTLRVLCGWRYKTIFQVSLNLVEYLKLSELKIAQKTHEQFVKGVSKRYTLFYNASDATKIPLREKPVKKLKKKSLNQKEEDDLKR